MPELLESLRDKLATLEPVLFELSDYLHQNVEESGQEYRSVERLCSVLTEFDFTVTKGVAGLPTGFRAESGPLDATATVAFLCEYDGLPPYGQSCGHNVSSACSIGAALLVAPIASQYGLRVVVVGTPAEEGFGGKYVMADNGIFDDIDVALLVYPGMADIAASRTLCARSIEVTFTGAAAHGAAHPELGRNALDAFVLGYTAVATLRQHIHPQAKVHGVIREGGSHPQIVPDQIRGTFVMRAPNPAILEELQQRVTNCFVGAATQTNTGVTVSPSARTSKSILPNTALAQAYENALKIIGRDAMPPDELTGAWSTDAGYLSRKLPLLQPQLAMTANDVSPHSHEFHAASTGNQAQEAIRAGSLALALTALDIATKSELAERIRQEFSSRRQAEC
ncbi:amidohydrolase [Paramicrobacterium humi]|uniref:Peptidase M20 domain-containing protein 2 n=1 Tax=Paramicrobacterium humi TaxID=640635 RepID=A0A1H4K8G5_9MICO|nr:amidohydrolase [Microbacterium humi]SEB54697.1 amidohydrolase [Microbacterium humi]